jgi:hypothetical protein
MIDISLAAQRLFDPGRQPPFASAFLIQFKELVDPVHSLVIAWLTGSSDIRKQLSEPITGMLERQILQALNQRVVFFHRLIIKL